MKKKIFRFKEFEINHTNSAMKVGVDSVLLGSITDFGEPSNLLDIGSGCGLLSLMAAQKTRNTEIIGVEFEESAFEESLLNCINSPWSCRLNMIRMDINLFKPKDKFEYIISNPPYFQSSSQSPSINRNLARQNNGLSLELFFSNVYRLLSDNGECTFIYPSDLMPQIFLLIKKYNFSLIKIINIYPKAGRSINRYIYTISNIIQLTENMDVIIRENTNIYTSQYKNITNDFYL